MVHRVTHIGCIVGAQKSKENQAVIKSSSLSFDVFLIFSPAALSPVSSIYVNTPAELQAFKGDTVTLSCTFTSSSTPTSKMNVDWSYRPQTGGPPQNVSGCLTEFKHFY